MPSYSHEKRDVLPHLAQMHNAKCWPPLLYTTLSDAEKLRSARMAASSGANASAGAPVAGGIRRAAGPSFLAKASLKEPTALTYRRAGTHHTAQ